MAMQQVSTISLMRNTLKQWRLTGDRIAFVPTMGNLHAGHIKLVTEARKQADKVVVSIFVNPTQVGLGEDFNSYPRTEKADQEKLQEAGADLLFLPAVNEIYAKHSMTAVTVPALSKLYCGASRPGHFEGVATVVTKLFNMVQPDVSVFGKKDFQQLLVIRTLVHDLNIPVEIVGVETEREFDGLAMSSRNTYLTAKERLLAPELYRAICRAREAVYDGEQSLKSIERQAIKQLTGLGFMVDYFSICRSQDLQPATEDDKHLLIMVAAKLGSPRLIDNMSFAR
jgi:pantoate--beta-alanine ligase